MDGNIFEVKKSEIIDVENKNDGTPRDGKENNERNNRNDKNENSGKKGVKEVKEVVKEVVAAPPSSTFESFSFLSGFISNALKETESTNDEIENRPEELEPRFLLLKTFPSADVVQDFSVDGNIGGVIRWVRTMRLMIKNKRD